MATDIHRPNSSLVPDSSFSICCSCSSELTSTNTIHKCNECLETCQSRSYCGRCIVEHFASIHGVISCHEAVEGSSLCEIHGGDFKFFCDTCDDFMCDRCLSSHLRHSVINLQEKASLIKKELLCHSLQIEMSTHNETQSLQLTSHNFLSLLQRLVESRKSICPEKEKVNDLRGQLLSSLLNVLRTQCRICRPLNAEAREILAEVMKIQHLPDHQAVEVFNAFKEEILSSLCCYFVPDKPVVVPNKNRDSDINKRRALLETFTGEVIRFIQNPICKCIQNVSDKFPPLGQSGVSSGETQLRWLSLGDVGKMSDETLLEMFASIGPVEKIVNRTDEIGYAYVLFVNPKHIDSAIEKLQCHPANYEPYQMVATDEPCLADTDSSSYGGIYICNLDKSVDLIKLRRTFGRFGRIVNCRLTEGKNGKSPAFASVHFNSKAGAVAAMRFMDGREFEGKKLSVKPFISKEEREKAKPGMALVANGRKEEFSNLYVKHIKEDVTEDDLKDLFSKYGTIKSAFVQRDVDGRSKSFGFVSFQQSSSAAQAVRELDGRSDVPLVKMGMFFYVAPVKKKAERQQELKEMFSKQKLIRNQLGMSQNGPGSSASAINMPVTSPFSGQLPRSNSGSSDPMNSRLDHLNLLTPSVGPAHGYGPTVTALSRMSSVDQKVYLAQLLNPIVCKMYGVLRSRFIISTLLNLDNSELMRLFDAHVNGRHDLRLKIDQLCGFGFVGGPVPFR